jgi:hypothetical protein
MFSVIRTVVSGVVALAIAITFFAVLLLKVQEPVLWIVIGIGVAMMVWNIVDAMREAKVVATLNAGAEPEGQQERGGVS